jgi:hypothetical protein
MGIGVLLGLGAASTRGGEEDDCIAGGGLRPANNISEREPATESLPDNNALHNIASTSSSVDETSFDVADSDNVPPEVQLRVELPLNSSVTELVKPQAAKPKSRLKKQNKKWKDNTRSNRAAAALQLDEDDDDMMLI